VTLGVIAIMETFDLDNTCLFHSLGQEFLQQTLVNKCEVWAYHESLQERIQGTWKAVDPSERFSPKVLCPKHMLHHQPVTPVSLFLGTAHISCLV